LFKLKRFTIILLAALALLAGACSSQPVTSPIPARNWTMSVATSADSSWAKGAGLFADLVQKRTGGQIKITVYPDAKLAGGDQVKELNMLQLGSIDFTYHSNLLYSNLDQSLAAISLPWLFTDYVQVDAALSGKAGAQLLKAVEAKGIVGLAFGENGFRQLTNNRRAVAAPDDLKGLRIRIPGVDLYNSIYQALGAEAVTLSFSKVPGALQKGDIDGQENPIDVIVTSQLYTLQKYITNWNYSYDAIILGINQKDWEGLPANAQAIIRQAALEASKEQIRLSRNAAETELSLLREKGMLVTELNAEEVQQFKARVGPVYTQWEGKLGPMLKELRGY
jgi:TRAP-type transport system periplasmic protein